MKYKLTIAYDGSKYIGWQTQHQNNSIQEALELAISKLFNESIDIVASGRTDAKVHALGQVIHFESKKQIPCEKVKMALNTLVETTIKIKKVELVPEDFHARFSAKSKRYDYYLSLDATNPFIINYMGIEKVKSLDLNLMQECAKVFITTTDFTSFTSSKIHELKNRVRTITKFEIIKENNYYHFIIEGNSFLRYMVRMIVQTVIEVGKHTITINDVEKMLVAKNKDACRYKASANGLYLVEVKY